MTTRKTFVKIAQRILACRQPGQLIESRASREAYMLGIDHVCRALADTFAADNPRFDERTFLTACGLPQ